MTKTELNRMMKRANLSAPDLAKLIGASPVTVWRWITPGQTQIPPLKAPAIRAALDKAIADSLEGVFVHTDGRRKKKETRVV